jgi:hypothetical protein
MEWKRRERISRLRRTEARVPEEREAARHDADDRERRAVEPDVGAEDRRVGAEPSPQIVRENGDGRPVRPDLLRSESAAEHRRYAQHIEQVR